MKRVIGVFLVMVMCCGVLVGCGASKKKVVMNEFDSETNQKCSIKGALYEIPKDWKQGEENTDKVKFYKTDEGMLQVSLVNIGASIVDDSIKEEFFDEMSSTVKKYKALSEVKEIKIDGEKAYQQEMQGEFSGKLYTTTMSVVDCGEECLVFWMYTAKDSLKDYSHDFEKVIASIVLPDAEDMEAAEVEKTQKNLDYIFLKENMRWNMALEEVKDAESRDVKVLGTFENRNPAYLCYEGNQKTDEYSNDVSSIYCFNDKQLKAYWSEFDTGIGNYKDVYHEIKTEISEKYGECESEEINWTDTSYQDDPEKWNDAFRYGYVTIKTTWHTSDSIIYISWSYNDGLLVVNAEPGFEDQL